MRAVGRILDHPWYVVGAIISVAILYWAFSTRQQSHYVKASFSSAFNLAPGLDVQIDGEDVGKLGKVEYENGHAIVEIGIDNDDYWPLHEGTTAESRYGTTIGNGTRKVDVVPGPKTNKELPEKGLIPMNLTDPVEDVDEVINVFSKEKREEVQKLTGNLDKGFRGPNVNRAIKEAGPGVESAGRFLSELGADNAALEGLIVNTRRAMGNLASRSETVEDLVTATAATFDEFAENSNAMEQALVESPATFQEARTTLQRVDASLGGLDELMQDLRPGATQLPSLARVATPALSQLRATVPSGVATVKAVRSASPALERLLTSATPFATRLGEDSEKLAPMISCIRPYAPEAMGGLIGLAGWTQGYGKVKDFGEIDKALDHPTRFDTHRRDPDGTIRAHGLRAIPIFTARTAHTYPEGVDEETVSKLFNFTYAYPRPAGLAAGEPQYRPDCDIGPEVLDPSKDRE